MSDYGIDSFLTLDNHTLLEVQKENEILKLIHPGIELRVSGYYQAIYRGYAYAFVSIRHAQEFLEEAPRMPDDYLALFVREPCQP